MCAWQYVYGNHPIAEAHVGAEAVQDGADCLMIDAESEYEGKYVQAQSYITQLRKLIGPSYPVALAGFPYVDYHPGFPYSVFLGPGGAQYNAPQMYWMDIGTSVNAVYAHTYAYNRVYQRQIDPLGQVWQNPPPGQIIRFRQLSRTYGAAGVSWWDWQQASPSGWGSISVGAGNLVGVTPTTATPILKLGSVGDLVVWAQEHSPRPATRPRSTAITGRARSPRSRASRPPRGSPPTESSGRPPGPRCFTTRPRASCGPLTPARPSPPRPRCAALARTIERLCSPCRSPRTRALVRDEIAGVGGARLTAGLQTSSCSRA